MSQEKRHHISELTFGEGLAYSGMYDRETGFRLSPMQWKRKLVEGRIRHRAHLAREEETILRRADEIRARRALSALPYP